MKGLHKLTFILLIIGGLNWLVWGIFGWEIGHIFGGLDAVVSRIIYILIGLSALSELFRHKGCCSACKVGVKPEKPAAPASGSGGDNVGGAGGNNN